MADDCTPTVVELGPATLAALAGHLQPPVSDVEWATAADLVRTLDPAEVRRRHEQATLYASAAVDPYDAFLTVVADMLDGTP